MLCPLCQKTLDKAILNNVEVDFCPDCFGLWFEKEELRWAKDEKAKDLKWLDIDLWSDKKRFKIAYGQKLCPSCRLPLYEVDYHHNSPKPSLKGKSPKKSKSRVQGIGKNLSAPVKVDVCNLCQGIWLDRGEFKKIIEHLKEKGSYEVLNNYSKNLVREFWEIFTGPETLREEILDFLTILKLLNYKFAVQHPTISEIISRLPK